MDSDYHKQDGSAKADNGWNNNKIIKSNLEVKDIQETDIVKPKRKPRKGFLKAVTRNLCQLKAFRLSRLNLLRRCRDLYVQTVLSCRCAQADSTAFISPESGGRVHQAPVPADSSSTGSSTGSSRRREEENLRRLIKVTESKSHSHDHQEFADDHDAELMEMGAKAISSSALGIAFGIARSNSVNNNYRGSFSWTSIAPIDEESPCYFPGSFKKKWATPLPRCASTSTTSTTN